MNNTSVPMPIYEGGQKNLTENLSGNPLELKILFYAGFIICLPLIVLGKWQNQGRIQRGGGGK